MDPSSWKPWIILFHALRWSVAWQCPWHKGCSGQSELDFILGLLPYFAFKPKGVVSCFLPELPPTLRLFPGLPYPSLLFVLSQHHTLCLQRSGPLLCELLEELSCRKLWEWVNMWWTVLCPQDDHTSYYLGTCSQLFEKLKTSIPLIWKSLFLPLGLCSFSLFCVQCSCLDSHMTGAFSLLRDQPKFCSPRRPSLDTPLEAASLSHHSIQLPCFF